MIGPNDPSVANRPGNTTKISPGPPAATSLSGTHCAVARYPRLANTVMAARKDMMLLPIATVMVDFTISLLSVLKEPNVIITPIPTESVKKI